MPYVIVACQKCVLSRGAAVPMMTFMKDIRDRPHGRCPEHGDNAPTVILMPEQCALPEPLLVSPSGQVLVT